MSPGSAAVIAPAPALASDDPGPAIRAGLAIVVLGLGGFFAWAALAPLDQAVAGAGTLAVAQQRQAVQPLAGGRVQQLRVAEGSRVRAGEVLLRLDTEAAAAELAAVRRQHTLARAAIERLQAQLAGSATLDFSPGLQAAAGAADAADILAAQARLFTTRRANFDTELQQLRAREAQLQAELDGYREIGDRHTQQLAILEGQQASLAGLARDGYYPKLNMMDLERDIAEVRTEQARLRSDRARTASALREAQAVLARRLTEQRRELETERLEQERQAAELGARESALAQAVRQAEITAPVDGNVVGLGVHTVGGVVQAGQRLMEIVPADGPYVVEARFALAATERLAAGQAVRLRFVTMAQGSTPEVAGQVLTVAADRLLDERSGQPYLLVRVTLAPQEAQRLAAAGIELRAGLPVEVLVNVGQRTLLSYLFKPVSDGLSKALIE